ncbi:MAG: sigma-70 family RNA polymerase sigma factor [Verrucomicrobiota bacterium]
MEADPTPSQPDENSRDVALMVRIGAGDHAAFRVLVERHQDAVVGTVAKMLGNPAEAQDISQQVFLRLWRHAKHYRPEAKFTTYLFTITRNLVFNESRRRRRRKEISSNEYEASSHTQIEANPGRQPDAELLQSELRQAVDAAIAALPEIQRMAVVLRRYEQMPYEQMAIVLGLSVSAVKSLLFRARTSLRDSLGRYLAEE